MSLLTRIRNTAKSERRHRTDAELNLIPLIDILSVMVAFLLVYSTDVEVIQNAKGVEIPQSTADVQPKHSVVVMITRDQLFVQGELVTGVTAIRESKETLIEPLRAVLGRASVGGEVFRDQDMAAREITVLADKSLPYAVVKKVMATCTASAYGKVSLAVIQKEKPVATSGLSQT